jgi:hypothetical protein
MKQRDGLTQTRLFLLTLRTGAQMGFPLSLLLCRNLTVKQD